MMRLEQRGAVAFNAGGNDGPLYSLCPVDQVPGQACGCPVAPGCACA